MGIKAEALTGGFTDAVLDSQKIFKKLMDGMARPGTLQAIDGPIHPPAPLAAATGGIILALCDHDTLVWLSGAVRKSLVPSWIGFHTGAPTTEEKQDACFAIVEMGSGVPALGLFAQGTQDYPDRSTTIVIELPDLENGPELTLSGPGIRDRNVIRPSGLPEMFATLWAENNAIFPRGVDVILTSSDHFICLPRTTRIEPVEA
ncbi:phosphonate C-P lyase system protein PhnH [Agrobacterium tumefaciens]|uniref:phosphonate C-P lyase system protein PhnH n=1 Tax=Agrobacterium tumefaciens TaxID=358 RepID=UPI00287EEE27|nr:phosphonate C-P lyase system protein PhnH [Agrobacterium tumefaciens]MDS7595848.1 phosphonate C-P lyase system protein PhnH [Agrobacterium tumefaciens]